MRKPEIRLTNPLTAAEREPLCEYLSLAADALGAALALLDSRALETHSAESGIPVLRLYMSHVERVSEVRAAANAFGRDAICSTMLTAPSNRGPAMSSPSSSDAAPRIGRLRANALAAVVMLLIQYCLGFSVNLYSTLPAGDSGKSLFAGFTSAVGDGPLLLSLHALLGTLLLITASVALARSLRLGATPPIALTALASSSSSPRGWPAPSSSVI